MKLFVFFLIFIFPMTCLAQPKLTQLTKSTLPKDIKYSGNIVQAVRWTDSTGNNIVLLTKDDKVQSKNALDEGYSEAALYAYHFLVSDNITRQTWRLYDYVKECPVDLFLDYVNKTFAVTDLNKDGKAEIWLMYKVSCQGDVSPIPMKIIMYEDDKKHAVRGTTQVQVSGTEKAGGEFSFDEPFKKASSAFREYAEKLWKRHKVETWGQ
jgi:hypothetical protein